MSLFRIYEESERKRDRLRKKNETHCYAKCFPKNERQQQATQTETTKKNDVRRNPESETIFFRTSIIHVQRIERH